MVGRQPRSGRTSSKPPVGAWCPPPSLRPLKEIQPLLVIGNGVSGYEAGEVWHLLDQRYDMKLSMVELPTFERIDLAQYTHVILVSGQ